MSRSVPTYTYDDNGNMLTRSKVTDGTTTLIESYTYDKLNRLTHLYDHVNNIGYELSYDAESRLTYKAQYKTNVEEDYDIYMYEDYYVWDGDNIVVVDYRDHEGLYVGDNNSFFVRGLDLIAKTPVFNYEDERIPNDYYYIQNRHGDVVTIVDYDGNAVNTYEYDEYGNITAETEGINNPFKYAGEVQNMPSSLVYLRNRIYIPRLQRFLQEDPIRDGTNWYVYCNSNPLNFWDPSGLTLSSMTTEGAPILLEQVIKVTGDNRYYIDPEDGKTIRLGDGELVSNDKYSETARALVDAAVNGTTQQITINCVEGGSATENSSTNYGTSFVNLYGCAENNDELSIAFVHELTHATANAFGWDNLGFYEVGNDRQYDNALKVYIKRKFMEAQAITVEQAFRSEMGYASRESLLIGQNDYGQFPETMDKNTITSNYNFCPNGLVVTNYIGAYYLKSFGSSIVNTLKDNYGY